MRRRAWVWMAGIAAAALSGCEDSRSYAQASCVLVDSSGTYADQLPEVMDIVKKGLLPSMSPGDSLVLVLVDDNSYEKGNVRGTITLDPRPSHANAQKLQFARAIDEVARRPVRSRYTDIRGGMMLCGEYLRESGAGRRAIVVFSDMKEELPRGARRKLAGDEFAGTRIAAMNVKRLQADNLDPEQYRKRLTSWEKMVKEHGASDWQVFLDPEKLFAYLEGER